MEHLILAVQLVSYFFVIVQIQHLVDEPMGLDYHLGTPHVSAWCCISISVKMTTTKESSASSHV